MAEIIKFDPSILTVEELLKRSANLKGCLILGTNPDDTHFFGVASLSVKEAVYKLELCKQFLMKIAMED